MGQVVYADANVACRRRHVVVFGNEKIHILITTHRLKLFEYMAAKRIIVASGTPAVKEIVGESTLLCPDDTADLKTSSCTIFVYR